MRTRWAGPRGGGRRSGHPADGTPNRSGRLTVLRGGHPARRTGYRAGVAAGVVFFLAARSSNQMVMGAAMNQVE